MSWWCVDLSICRQIDKETIDGTIRVAVSVLGIDPGKTTGIAKVIYDPVQGFMVSLTEAPSNAVWRVVETYWQHSPNPAPSMIAIERFIIGNRSSKSSDSQSADFTRHLIGQIIFSGWPYIRRTASEVKAWATDERLKAAQIFTPGFPHARDASRQALFVLVKLGWAPDPLSKVFKSRFGNAS